MKKIILQIFSILPLLFVVLYIADIFFIERYFFRTRYAVLQTPILGGLIASYLIVAVVSELRNYQSKYILWLYKIYIVVPLTIFLVFIFLVSTSRA